MGLSNIFDNMNLINSVLAKAITVTFTNPWVASGGATSAFAKVYGEILHYLLILGAVFYMFAILLSAYYFMTSGGDTSRLSVAKKILIYSTIGFVIVVLAPALLKGFIDLFK